MYNVLAVLDPGPAAAPGAADALVAQLDEAARALPGIATAAAGRTLPRALNGGQAIWRLAFATEADWQTCRAASAWHALAAPLLDPVAGLLVDRLFYRVARSRASPGDFRGGIWRCLAMAANASASREALRQFERDTLLMPDHVSTIRGWALGEALSAFGRRRWTHIWEQEFDDVEGLEGEYMLHPIHWGLVDGWFDPECPQRIIDPYLIHAAMAIDAPVIL